MEGARPELWNCGELGRREGGRHGQTGLTVCPLGHKPVTVEVGKVQGGQGCLLRSQIERYTLGSVRDPISEVRWRAIQEELLTFTGIHNCVHTRKHLYTHAFTHTQECICCIIYNLRNKKHFKYSVVTIRPVRWVK